MDHKRRDFIKSAAIAAASGLAMPQMLSAAVSRPAIRVLVWDERMETEKQGYDDWLGNCIAARLARQPALSVRSVALDDPEQGISEEALDHTDVLIWWGHTRQDEVLPEKGKSIVKRILAGSLSLIALHSAHWSSPFMEALDEITRRKLFEDKSIREQDVTFIPPQEKFKAPGYDTRITPYTVTRKFPDGSRKFQVHLPVSCFPAYRNDGKPSHIKVLKPGHPIMKGIPLTFQLPQTEMYDEPFHVPAPDDILFEECWESGEWFRSGMLWNLGKGKVFYFRPGHETFPVYKEKWPVEILSNAVHWMASS